MSKPPIIDDEPNDEPARYHPPGGSQAGGPVVSGPKFTPGPWIFYADTPSTDPNWHIVTTANKMRVLANVHIEPGNLMDVANAYLIAAAPDMYEALVLARDVIEINHKMKNKDWDGSAEPFSAIGVVRAALAKARGEQ